jgi:hypothetical protein
MSFQSPEPLGCFQYRRARPAQRHRGIAPVFQVAGHPPDAADHILDDVDAGLKSGEVAAEA